MSGSNRVRNGYPRMISPVDFVTCKEQRMVSSPILRYKRAKCVIGKISPLATLTDSGFLSLCKGQRRRLTKEYEMKLPPAPESMRAAHCCPSTSKGIVSRGATFSSGHKRSELFE